VGHPDAILSLLCKRSEPQNRPKVKLTNIPATDWSSALPRKGMAGNFKRRNMERIVIETTPELKQKLKIKVAKKGLTMKSAISIAIENWLAEK
jgi:hypothetical protein